MAKDRRGPRLAHVTTVPLTLGFFTGQVGFMKERGFEVHAISSPGELLDRFGERESVPVYAVEMPRQITPVRDLQSIVQLYQCLRRIRPDIVHAHTPKGGLLGMIAAWLARTPVRIYHIRGLPMMTAQGKRRRLLRATEWIACALSHQVLCVSHSVRDVAIAEQLCPPEKIQVLLGGSGNGVDATGRFDPARHGARTRNEIRQRYGIPEDAVVIGFVGRLVRDKGIGELAAAFGALRAEYPTAHLLLVGPFEPQDPVPAPIREQLERDDHVHLTDHVHDVAPYYAAMDVLVLPTYREGFPNAPLEAASMALPVVATRIPGCVDAVADGVTGTLVPPRDAAALAWALRLYMQEPTVRQQYGQAGRARVLREFRQEALWEALSEVYGRLLRARRVKVEAAVARAAGEPANAVADAVSSSTRDAGGVVPETCELVGR